MYLFTCLSLIWLVISLGYTSVQAQANQLQPIITTNQNLELEEIRRYYYLFYGKSYETCKAILTLQNLNFETPANQNLGITFLAHNGNYYTLEVTSTADCYRVFTYYPGQLPLEIITYLKTNCIRYNLSNYYYKDAHREPIKFEVTEHSTGSRNLIKFLISNAPVSTQPAAVKQLKILSPQEK